MRRSGVMKEPPKADAVDFIWLAVLFYGAFLFLHTIFRFISPRAWLEFEFSDHEYLPSRPVPPQYMSAGRQVQGGIHRDVLGAMPAKVCYEKDEAAAAGVGVDCCAVCMEELEEEEVYRVLPGCGHWFHQTCIDKWLQIKRNCPTCRAEFDLNLHFQDFMVCTGAQYVVS